MIRKAITICTLIGLLVAHAQAVLTLAAFELNRDYIAAALCVKKAVPKNCCLGKCHLKKQLSKDKALDARPNFERAELAAAKLTENATDLVVAPSTTHLVLVEGRYLEFPSSVLTARIFHPPCQG